MGYLLLILGVALWSGAHLFKRFAPDRRAAMGERGKGLVSVLLLVSIVLMVLGYRGAETVVLWSAPGFFTHMNNLLMLGALYLYVASVLRTRITTKMRHPQLTGVKIWALAHLLVNGDTPSFLLFGGLFVWALAEVIVLNRVAPPGPYHEVPVEKEIAASRAARLMNRWVWRIGRSGF